MKRTLPAQKYSWRVIDIVTATVLGIAVGFIFWIWNIIGYAGFTALDTLTPGFGGLVAGLWMLGGVLGGLIIRKPGAALVVEVIAALTSALLGNQWGITTLYSGLAQGLGAEIVFAVFAYRRFTLPVSILAGIGAGLGAVILELFTSANLARSLEFNLIYATCVTISSVVLAGILGFYLVRALARTGVLDRFGPGRELR